MRNKIKAYLDAGKRSARYLLHLQRPNGAVTGDDFPWDIFHKLPYSLSIAGHFPEAHRLVNWVRNERLMKNKDGIDFHLQPVRMQIYKHAWFVHGSQRLGRFDLSYPAFDFMLRAQLACGGFACESPDEGQVRALTTGWCGVAAIYMGRLDIARRAGEALITMFDGQPQNGRFFFFMTPEGKVKSEPPPQSRSDEVYKAETVIDAGKTDQYYWEIGMAMILLARLYQVTREERWRQYALKYFEFNVGCQPDGFAHANAGKNGMGAALIYLVTGDTRAREAAMRECDFLCATQEAAGAWVLPPFPDGFITRIDLASEYTIWLHEIASILHATL